MNRGGELLGLFFFGSCGLAIADVLAQAVPPNPMITGRSWEAVLVASICVSAFALIGWMIKHNMSKAADREKESWERSEARETRLANRITALETFLESEHIQMVARSSEIIAENSLLMKQVTGSLVALTDVLKDKPCLLHDKDTLRKVLDSEEKNA